MGRGSPIPPMLRPKIVEQYQKGVSQRKIAKSLKLSSSTVHNIIQRSRESGTISVRKGQGRKTILDARDLRAHRRHCITYRNATVMEITTWAQEYFQKTLSVNTIHRAIRRRRLKLYRSKKKPYLNMIQKRRRFLWAKAHLKWTVAKWKTVLWSDQSKFEVLFGKLGRHVIRTKEDKDNPSCYWRSVQKPASLMVWGCMSACGMGSLHIWKGTINAEREDLAFSNMTMPDHILHQLQHHGCVEEGSGEEYYKVDPKKEDPNQSVPYKVEGYRVDPNREDPNRVDPKRKECYRLDPNRVGPNRMDPYKEEGYRVDPNREEYYRVDSNKEDANRVDLNRAPVEIGLLLVEEVEEGGECTDRGRRGKVGCELGEKERFWSELDGVMESIPTGERVVIGADFNGHVGEGNAGDEEVIGKFGVKERNLEGQMVVDFAKRMDMAVVNTYFQKREEHRVTYKSGDLEKAYDRVPREELWYCMRKSGVAEKYVRVVQDMYERSRTVVRCAVGQTEEFKVQVGLHQGSALSPFLFATVMDQLSEEVRQESPWTMMFADDIVICSERREQVEENLERWRFALERRGMKVSRSKTEYMCVNEREGSGTVRLQGEEVKKVQEFKYLGSTVQSNGECGKEVKKRVQAGWNGWRKVSGVLCDQKISARIKGKVYRTVVRAAMLYGLETVSLRKRQESELEVAELKMLSVDPNREDPYKEEGYRVDPNRKECYRLDPNSVDPNREDPYKEEGYRVDPNRKECYRLDPNRVGPNRVDSYKEKGYRVDPNREDLNSVDPYKEDCYRMDPNRGDGGEEKLPELI
ncbi:hypothetical protein QTP70_008520 [Hemibagrus guttatus]|uniref:ribonuclease H n=1 Tax=Hemibagrus guttatus TaxID=175788 RepID=A0AAE0V8F2_9TELE|nr:hypothetical protein QTP70_008520 [Hemibagrus guttatus]